jgi:hypothetical protein
LVLPSAFSILILQKKESWIFRVLPAGGSGRRPALKFSSLYALPEQGFNPMCAARLGLWGASAGPANIAYRQYLYLLLSLFCYKVNNFFCKKAIFFVDN